MSKVLSVLAKAVQQDEESAAELMDQIAMEVIADEIDAHGGDIELLARPQLAELVAKAKRGLLRGYVAKAVAGTYPDESYARVAAQLNMLTEVIKDDEPFDPKKHPRGQGGRFTRSISHAPVSSLSHIRDYRQLSPANRSLRAAGKDPDTDPARDKFLAEQGEWEDAQRKMKEFQDTFPGSTRNVDAVFSFRTKDGSSEKFSVPLGKPLDANIAAAAGYGLDDRLDFVEIQPGPGANEALKDKVARFNDIAGQTGSPRTARLMTSYDPEKLRYLGGVFGDDINGEAVQRPGIKRFFSRTQAAGNVLEGITGAEKYGKMVRLAGEFGSEADRALGPAAQRAAYRYRGTEKEADPTLRRAFTSRDMQLVDAVGEANSGDDLARVDQIREGIKQQKRERGGTSPVLGALEHRLTESANSPEPMLGDELAMKVRSDVAAAHMMSTLPDDPRAAELSRLSGHVLPSQGVIIDHDGDVVSQAVGYGEDHYLPFDLKNIRALKGGQYVRTRMEGGPTGEDVYALVATGARMGTVVSSSGVFTFEMDPNFRGRRGSSDKARMVYQRYLEILDAVDGSGLYSRDLSAADKARVEETASAMNYEIGGTEHQAMLNAERAKQKKLTPDQVEAIEAEARQELQASGRRFTELSTARQNAEVTSLTEERVLERKGELIREVSLNAEGYALAMKTLQQQFPYFIRTATYEPLRNKETGGGFFAARGMDAGQAVRQRSLSDDRGYVRPGGLRSEGTKEGFYATAGARRLKRTKRDEPEESPKAIPAAAGTAAVTTPGAAAPAAAPSQATAVPSGKLAEALAPRSTEFTNRRDVAVKELHQAWAVLSQSNQGQLGGQGLENLGGAQVPWDQVKGRRDLAAAWLMDAVPAQFNEVMSTDQASALDVLSDRDLIASTVRGKLSAGAAGWGDPQAIEALQLPGVKDSDSFARYVADTAQRVVDYQQLANPAFFRTTEGVWETSGPREQPDLATITTQEGLDAYAKQHPETARLAQTIGLAGDRPRRFSDMKSDVAERLKALKAFSNFSDALRAAATSISSPDQMKERAVAQKLSEAGIDADQLGKMVGRQFGSPVEIADWARGEAGVSGADRAAMEIQRAWSLAAVSRLVDAAEGGDLVPKDEPALARLAKAAPSLPRVAVLSPKDPRSLVVKRLVRDQPLPRAFRAQRR